MKFLGNAVFFVLAYVVLMIPTYLLPYIGSNSTLSNAASQAAYNQMNPFFWLHAGVLVLLILITWLRGSLVGKKWLTVFPFLAAVFDMVPGLNFIPLIPTVLHLCAIVMGARGDSAAVRVQST